jgi:hypothetical protein
MFPLLSTLSSSSSEDTLEGFFFPEDLSAFLGIFFGRLLMEGSINAHSRALIRQFCSSLLSVVASIPLGLAYHGTNRTVQGVCTTIHDSGRTSREVACYISHGTFRVVRYMANGTVALLHRVAGNVSDTAHKRANRLQNRRKNPTGSLTAAGTSRLGSATSGVLA